MKFDCKTFGGLVLVGLLSACGVERKVDRLSNRWEENQQALEKRLQQSEKAQNASLITSRMKAKLHSTFDSFVANRWLRNLGVHKRTLYTSRFHFMMQDCIDDEEEFGRYSSRLTDYLSNEGMEPELNALLAKNQSLLTDAKESVASLLQKLWRFEEDFAVLVAMSRDSEKEIEFENRLSELVALEKEIQSLYERSLDRRQQARTDFEFLRDRFEVWRISKEKIEIKGVQGVLREKILHLETQIFKPLNPK